MSSTSVRVERQRARAIEETPESPTPLESSHSVNSPRLATCSSADSPSRAPRRDRTVVPVTWVIFVATPFQVVASQWVAPSTWRRAVSPPST